IPELIPIDRFHIVPPEPDPRFTLPYRDNWGRTFVTIRQGDREELLMADANGDVQLPAGFAPGAATLTVTRNGYRPAMQEVTLQKPLSGNGGCLGWVGRVVGRKS